MMSAAASRIASITLDNRRDILLCDVECWFTGSCGLKDRLDLMGFLPVARCFLMAVIPVTLHVIL
jgi:hypothetical protein